MGPGTPSLPFSPGLCMLLWFAALSLSLSVCLSFLLKYLPLWLLSVSSAGVSSFRPLKVKGAPGLKSSLFSWDRHAPWREPWGSSLGKPSHANDCEVYIPALTAPQNPYTWQMKPYLTSLCGKGQNWTLDFKTSPPTVLPISGIASPPTQVLKLKSLSHPWSLPFISLPTPNPSANLSALLSKDLGHTLLSPPWFSPPLEGHSNSSLVSPPLLPKVSPATPRTPLEGRCKHLSQITSLPCSESSLSSISFRLKVRVLLTANQAQHILPHHLSDFIFASLPLNSHAGLLCIPLVPISQPLHLLFPLLGRPQTLLPSQGSIQLSASMSSALPDHPVYRADYITLCCTPPCSFTSDHRL